MFMFCSALYTLMVQLTSGLLLLILELECAVVLGDVIILAFLIKF